MDQPQFADPTPTLATGPTPTLAMHGPFRRLRPLPGLHYQEFLRQLHQRLGPVRYLEIGTQVGESLRHAHGRAVAIDPGFRLDVAQWRTRAGVSLHETTSDAYFAGHDPREYLKGPIDVAFIDGMHLSDYVLRDFIAVERFCSRHSIVILHDALPLNHEMTERDRQPSKRRDRELAASWTGDVWRVLPELTRLRPDLRIEVLDCPPTGLVVVRSVDSTSDVLGHAAGGLVRKFMESEPDEEAFWAFVLGVRLANSRTWLVGNAQALDRLQRASMADRGSRAA
jgi:Methyltransferase domain